MVALYDIPRSFLIDLTSIDSQLDDRWQEKVSELLSPLGQEQKNMIFEKILNKKGIYLDQQGQLQRQKQPAFKKTIQALTDEKLTTLGIRLNSSLTNIQNTACIIEIADIIEAACSAIELFDTKDSFSLNQERAQLRIAYLYALADVIRDPNFNFDVPKGQRKLSLKSIKTYIVQIFIKERIQKYEFRSLSHISIEKMENPFVKQFIAGEAKHRRFELVDSDHYYFLIGPASHSDQNPYSLRRFLTEDSAMNGSIVYLNHVVIPKQAQSEQILQQYTAWAISRMFTIERKLNEAVDNFIGSLDLFQDKYLKPLLRKPLSKDGSDLEVVIETRLLDYEKQLSMLILNKLPAILQSHNNSADDFEYLFFSVKRLLQDILADIQEFSSQASTLWSNQPKLLMLRITAYLILMDKLKIQAFSARCMRTDELGADLHPLTPLKIVTRHFEESHEQQCVWQAELEQLIKQRNQPAPRTGFAKLFGKKSTSKYTVEEIQDHLLKHRKDTIVTVARIIKTYRGSTVYPEFELGYEVNEHYRHYAFANGGLGIGLLPRMIQLPEDPKDLDAYLLYKQCAYDILKSRQTWDITHN